MTWFCLIVITICLLLSVNSYTSDEPHPHRGILKPYTGKQLSYNLEAKDVELLKKGKPVIIQKLDSDSDRKGRAAVIQDIDAPPHVCMEKIVDFLNYPKFVSVLKSIDIYHSESFQNGTEVTKAQFNSQVLAFKVGYFLRLELHPQHNTLTWTLDYDRKSDLDDSVGHWQVMAHPSKRHWTRVLYSTGVTAPSWFPGFVVKYVLENILTEATTWLKREAELHVRAELMAGRNVFDSSSSSVQFRSEAGGEYVEEGAQEGVGSVVGRYVPSAANHLLDIENEYLGVNDDDPGHSEKGPAGQLMGEL